MTRHAFHTTRAFTLAELVIASAVVALVLIVLAGLYVQGTQMMRRTFVRVWAQQRARTALETIVGRAREAYACQLYNAYTNTPGTQVTTGNYLRLLLTDGTTCGVYRSGTVLYHVPSEATDSRATSADDSVLAMGLAPQPVFISGYNSIRILMRLTDDRATNETLMAVDAYATLRNF